MQRKLIITEDGSPSFAIPAMGEHYHSVHGARTESQTIYIDAAFMTQKQDEIHVLEFGIFYAVARSSNLMPLSIRL